MDELRDLTLEEALAVYTARLDRLQKIDARHHQELADHGRHLVKRCIAETLWAIWQLAPVRS